MKNKVLCHRCATGTKYAFGNIKDQILLCMVPLYMTLYWAFRPKRVIYIWVPHIGVFDPWNISLAIQHYRNIYQGLNWCWFIFDSGILLWNGNYDFVLNFRRTLRNKIISCASTTDIFINITFEQLGLRGLCFYLQNSNEIVIRPRRIWSVIHSITGRPTNWLVDRYRFYK